MVIAAPKKMRIKELLLLINNKFYETFIKENDADEDSNNNSSINNNSGENDIKDVEEKYSNLRVEVLKYMDCTVPVSEIVEDILEHNAHVTCVI